MKKEPPTNPVKTPQSYFFAILKVAFGNPFMNSNLRWTIVGSSTCIVVLLLLGARSGGAVAHDDVYGHLRFIPKYSNALSSNT